MDKVLTDFIKKLAKKTDDSVTKNENCGKPVHNFYDKDLEFRDKTSIDYWRYRALYGDREWHKLRPFSYSSDPMSGCPPSLRFKLLEEAFNDLPQAEQFGGMDYDEWISTYVENWDQVVRSNNKDLFKEQAVAVLMYSDNEIALRKQVKLYGLPRFKRGSRGHTLRHEALDILPSERSTRMKAFLKETQNILCHIMGNICILPETILRYIRKT